MSDTDTTVEAREGADLDPGITGRGLLSGMALASESLRVAKLAGSEALEVADATITATFDVLDDLADDMAGPLAGWAKAPTTVGRASYRAGSTGVRRVLAAA